MPYSTRISFFISIDVVTSESASNITPTRSKAASLTRVTMFIRADKCLTRRQAFLGFNTQTIEITCLIHKQGVA